MKNTVHKLLPETVNTQITYTRKTMSTYFQIKAKSKFDHHHHDHAKCLSKLCDEDYIGESGRRITKQVKDHNRRDCKSHILKHSLESGHEHVASFGFSIICNKVKWKQMKAKIDESLLIKQLP